MKTYSLYHLATGLFDGRSLTLPDDAATLALNTPAGMGAHEGMVNHRTHRLDLASGELVAWTPPPPSQADLEAAALRAAQQRVDQLERSQARAMRTLALDPFDHTARARLQEIEAAIVATGIRRS